MQWATNDFSSSWHWEKIMNALYPAPQTHKTELYLANLLLWRKKLSLMVSGPNYVWDRLKKTIISDWPSFKMKNYYEAQAFQHFPELFFDRSNKLILFQDSFFSKTMITNYVWDRLKTIISNWSTFTMKNSCP